MRLRLREVLLGAMLLWACPAQSGPEDGFPLEDPQTERALFQGEASGAEIQGGWKVASGGLYLAQPVRDRWNYWLANGEFSDGMIRARVQLGSRPDFTLLLRARIDEDERNALSGYGISIEGDDLVLYRWDDGVVRPMGPRQTIEGLLDRNALEVVAYQIGPQLLANIYDPQTLELLATTVIRDAAHVRGQIGIRAFQKQDTDTRLTHLSIQPSGPFQADPTLFGSERLVRVHAADMPKMPTDLAEAILFEQDNEVVLLTDPTGLERIRRAQITPVAVSSEIPWWAVDEEYRLWRNAAPVRTQRGFRLDLSYKDHRMVEALLRGYHQRYPDITRLETLGTTGQGRAILALRITDNPGDDEDEPMVLLNGSHHGNELLSIDYALDAVRMLLEERDHNPQIDRWVRELDIWVVPLVNPDGNHMFTTISRAGGRKNIRDTNNNGRQDPWDGVDLNRNYPFRWGSLGEKGSKSWRNHGQYRGPQAGSEPETQAMMALARQYHPAAVISWHTNATILLSPYTIDNVDNPDPDEAWTIAEQMVEAAGIQPNRKPYRVRRKLYSVDGTDQDWHRFAHGSVAFIVEGSHRRPDDPEVRAASIAGARPLLTTLLDRILDGPTLSGVVVDNRGRPLPAEITIDEIQNNAGEVWTARPLDGRFDRLLPEPGTYTVRAKLDGYRETSQTIRIVGREEVQLTLKRAR